MSGFQSGERKYARAPALAARPRAPLPGIDRQVLALGIDEAIIDESAEEVGLIERVGNWKITVKGKEFLVKNIATIEEDAEDEFEGPAVKVSLGWWYKDGKKLYVNAIRSLAESKEYKVKSLVGEPYNLFIGKRKV